MNQIHQTKPGWLVVLFCLGLLGFFTPGFAADETLGPGDSVRVTVFENPNLTTETRVSANGMISFPLVGNVQVGGLTPSGAAERIAHGLKSGNFIRNPQVSLSVVQVRSRQVSVLGQVARPGRYALDEATTTLTDILALAGGIGPTGDDIVTLVRTRDGKSEKRDIDLQNMLATGDLSANPEIENGDTIYVRRVPMFYIHGEVQRAGSYRLENNMSVMQAIAAGGGMTVRGTERGIKISRRTPDGGLSRQEAQLGDQIRPDDTIFIPESFF